MNKQMSIVLAGLVISGTAMPQSQPISQGLGVVVYPAKSQSSSKQAADEHECYNWAQQQTGFTPGPPPAPSSPPPQHASTGGGAAGGAVRGAAGGALIGAVAGDAGKGAAIGATTGVVVGASRSRRAQQQQQAQAQQAQQADASNQAAHQDRMDGFKKAFGTCMQGRSYTVSQ
jgi:predicted lipid-binding transport protein (Tim44 family)